MSKQVIFQGVNSKISYTVEIKPLAKGSQKVAYLTKDKKHVIAIYMKDLDNNEQDRLKDLIENYRLSIFEKTGKAYWQKLMAWPIDYVITPKGKWGLVMPFIPDTFRFEHGDLKGEEKKPNWFWSKNARNMVDSKELGDWRKYLINCLHLSRGIRKFHSIGIAHSDISFNNVLTDSKTGLVNILDLDDLNVPGKYKPNVIGTPGFIAPEVIVSMGKDGDKQSIPCRETDLHAMAVVIYMLLFRRHPLEGKKVWSEDAVQDEQLQKGAKALFIEDSNDSSNQIKDKKENFPWSDTNRLPYAVAGPFLSVLFQKAFEDGLHNPAERPLAGEWETAITKTLDLLVPCSNKKCSEKWFVFNKSGKCPFCGSSLGKSWPIINLYKYDSKKKEYVFEKKQLIPYHGKKLFLWHTDSSTHLSEKLEADELKSQGYFQEHNGEMYIVNERIKGFKACNANGEVSNGAKHFKIDEQQKVITGEGASARCFEFKMLKFN